MQFIQLHSKMIQHFKASQIFDNLGIECEGAFNEIYCPPAFGSVFFYVPKDNEEMEDLNPCEQEVAKLLINYGGVAPNDMVCIDFDY